MNKKLIIIGASGHGRVCADIAKLNGYESIRFLDDDKSVRECAGYEIIGSINDLEKYVRSSSFFVAIGNYGIRSKITDQIKARGGNIITLIHPDAVIAEDVLVGEGSVVMAGTVINSGTVIGKGCIINTSSSVDHDCRIGEFVHVAVGAHIAGTVKIGSGTWIGAGATISNNIEICSECMIGVGAVVVNAIKEAGIYIGVPVRRK